jgi:hypothetical protein
VGKDRPRESRAVEDRMETKTFAFKVAEKKPKNNKWKARDGVSIAGCTYVEDGVYWWSHDYCGRDCWMEC